MSGYAWFLCVAISVYYVIWITYTVFFHPLKHIPGPFLARISRLWITLHSIRGDMEHEQRRLHKKYGALVIIAPDEVACAAPEAKNIIYPMKSANPKTDFYSMWQNPSIGNFHDHFSQRDEKVHATRRRIVNHVYTLSNILRSEEYIDKCSALFMQRMAEYADAGQVVDLGEWLQMYAFDVIGELFFGRMFGFMENRHDYGSYIALLDMLLPFITVMSVIPSYLRPVVAISAFFLPSVRRLFKAIDTIAGAARACVAERQERLHTSDKESPRRDLLQQLFDIYEEKGTEVNFGLEDMAKESYSAIFAGSDTTAIAMRAVFYYLMINPPAYAELMSEIDAAVENGSLSRSGPVAYAQALKLPYLCAAIKEAMRLHPSVGLTLPRYAPAGGLWTDGRYIPPGYRIGMNAAVVQYDQSIFGDDSYSFRPSRWLTGAASDMDRGMIHFGAGTRTCLGKNISLSEIHKLVPQVLRDFTIELESERPWKTSNFFFNKQTGIHVYLHKRNVTGAGSSSETIVKVSSGLPNL